MNFHTKLIVVQESLNITVEMQRWGVRKFSLAWIRYPSSFSSLSHMRFILNPPGQNGESHVHLMCSHTSPHMAFRRMPKGTVPREHTNIRTRTRRSAGSMTTLWHSDRHPKIGRKFGGLQLAITRRNSTQKKKGPGGGTQKKHRVRQCGGVNQLYNPLTCFVFSLLW